MLPKAIYKFNVIPIKLHMTLFTELEQISPKIYMESSKTQDCQSNLEEKQQSRRPNPPDFRQYYKATRIKTVWWYWHQNRHRDQWNWIEHPEISPHTYRQLMFGKGGRNIQEGKVSDCPQKQALGETTPILPVVSVNGSPRKLTQCPKHGKSGGGWQ